MTSPATRGLKAFKSKENALPVGDFPMKVTKFKFHKMEVEDLEKERNVLFDKLTQGKGNHGTRNLFLEIVGVLEAKKLRPEPLYLGSKSVA